jgi:photosystem II stability/assembly factor-like uncharacterized protein
MKMKKRVFPAVAAVLISTTALLVLLYLTERTNPAISNPALAAPLQITPTVTLVHPSSAPNDLDTPIVITGTDFADGATVTLGDESLSDVSRVSSTTLQAMVPWGMDPGVYTLTVTNPDSESDSLANAFTVTLGIGVWNAGELYGGSVEAVAVNPMTPTTVYAASAHVGLFRSRDGGESWSFQFAGGGGVMHPVIDPRSPNRLYMHGPWTLYRSDDEGDTWTALNPQFPFTETEDARCTPFFIRPYVHPVSDTVYAVACGSANGNQSGLLKSDNHGDTWESITDGITDTQITAMACHPQDPQTMYVGTGNGHIFVSSNGGITWTYASKPVECVGTLAVNPFGSHELWVASDNSFGDPCVLRTSANADLTAWTTLTETTEGCSWPGPSIDFAPDISGTVFVADFGDGGLRTTNGGSTWTLLSPGSDSLVQDLAPHPTQTDTIYLADKWEGVYKTTDGGDNWHLANQGLTALYPQQMDVHPGRPGVIYARLNSEDLYKGTQGGGAWQRLSLSRIASVQIDPITPTHIYAGKSGDIPYVYMSDDDGQAWTSSAPLPKSAQYSECYSFPWILLAIPKQPGTLLVGAQHHCDPLPHPANIYRSTDYGEHWQRVYTYTYTAYGPFGELAYDAVTSTIVYAAIPNGEDGLLRSTNSGQNWERAGEGEEGMEFAKNIAVEPVPPYRVFVMTGYPLPYLYFSEDHGMSWTQASSPPDAPVIGQIV